MNEVCTYQQVKQKVDLGWKSACALAWFHPPPLIEHLVAGKDCCGRKAYEITVDELTVKQFQSYTSFYKIMRRKNPVPLPLSQKFFPQ